jgi:MraZ protein
MDVDAYEFDGNFEYTLDDKGRLAVPRKHRPAFAGGVVVARGEGRCVALWRPQDFKVMSESVLEGIHRLSPEHRDLRRYFYGGSEAKELDSAGRVALPVSLIAHAELGKDVTIVGARECLEIWDRAAWSAYEPTLPDTFDAIAARHAST